jgi:hypothetical protein
MDTAITQANGKMPDTTAWAMTPGFVGAKPSN